MADVDGSVFVFSPAFASGTSGNVVDGSLFALIGSAGGESTPPVIDNFNPPVGTPLVRSDSVSFDVTDNRALRRALVLVTLDGETYCVHDGFTFRGEFANPQSSRTPIVGGYHYIVKRNGGWTTPPTFEVLAIDTSGNEAT